MQFIDLAAQQAGLRNDIDNRIKKVLDHGQYINGPEVQELEKALSAYCGTTHAVGCSSGTDALLLALMAYGVGSQDAVLTTPFTFIATAEVVSILGAVPVFVDIDPVTFNMDPKALQRTLQNLPSGPRARGIIAVDLFGLPAPYDEINAIAKEHGLFVIEDAAQSFGGAYKGKQACSLADIGCTSFFPAKPLGCYGDGGMCFTNDANLNKVMLSLRVHGQGTDKYNNVRIGINGRLDTMQAAILLSKFTVFPQEIVLRQEKAARYADGLKNTAFVTPVVPEHSLSAWAQYTLLARDEAHRAASQKALKDKGVPTAVYYPKPLHLQEAFKNLAYKPGDFPVSEHAAARVFSVPMHPYLCAQDQDKIIAALRAV